MNGEEGQVGRFLRQRRWWWWLGGGAGTSVGSGGDGERLKNARLEIGRAHV